MHLGPALCRSRPKSPCYFATRSEIADNRRHRNVHLYNSLKKSLYKPSAFFKGILFPLVGSGTCTLREAHIVSSVMARVSIPILHSAAGLKGLCDLAAQQASNGENAAATNVFIKVLLDKGLALPYQVIDALVFFFLRFRSVDPAAVKEAEAMERPSEAKIGRQLPVLWHQCLLSFAQRYRNDINEDQREVRNMQSLRHSLGMRIPPPYPLSTYRKQLYTPFNADISFTEY